MNVSDKEWSLFERFVKSISTRDTDGRLKLKGHSKWSKPYTLRVWNRLTGHEQLTKKQLVEVIELFINETDGESFFQEMKAENGALDLRLKANPDLLATLAEQMSAILDDQGASNYCEWKFSSAKTGKAFTLLVQRDSGKTPAQRFNGIKGDLEKLIESWTKRQDQTIKKPIAAGVIKSILEDHK